MRRELDPERCQRTIFEGRGVNYQCTKKPTIERDGKLYCKIHDPEYIKAKQAEWQATFDKERAEREKHWVLVKARSQAIKNLTLEELKQVTPALIRKALEANQ